MVHLWCEGVPLDDIVPLAQLPVNVLDITVGLPGGKVHGSLARAGKVKSQTPAVDKRDKKKSKTGRAKRRAQFNRRFNMAVSAAGRGRRGPNSQDRVL
uniref:40S ribosomal protein S30 n=1 Tax=Anopheles dirus TaxID=7168 RepID=A0A182NHU0_9DIPT